ncbi:hypothetical protein BJG92_02721 [Arthrobacter sp. SO5]|uniref:hypothetical protein n=1 Tax=Arthrobacter sp. SO5 TaxID=1897055 RepID=UPI001E382EC1|nr:hypothetical protein [Arthrobacter sp. SO5]MCB5275173.1 hypothetical protein [Arthrobacter sp. SO5]
MMQKTREPGRTPLPRGIAAPARKSLAHAGVETLEQLVQLGEHRLAGMAGVCPRTMAQLQDALDDHGLTLRTG